LYKYEVLMLKRHSKMTFSNHWVFPGGMLDFDDIKQGNQLNINPL